MVEKRVTVIGTVDNVQCKVWVEGVPATLTDNIFTAEITLDAKGAKTVRTITVKTVDQRGQTGEASLPVYLLKKTPVITLEGPAEGWVTNETAVTVRGTLDDNGVDLTINGTPVRVQGRSFSYRLPLAEGLNVITVAAKDHFGNTSTEERLVIRDTEAPEVLLQMPPSGAVLNYFPAIVGSVSDLTAVQATVNGQTVPVAGGVFRVEGLTFAPGENIIAITVTDALGHVTKINTSFIFDPTPPELVVEQPQNGQILNAQPIDVTGQIKDAYGASVLVNGIPSLIDGERFTASVPLTEGANTLTTVAIDLAGQQAMDVRQVVLDTTPPDPFTPVTDPASWGAVSTPVITFFTTDATSGVDHYEVSVDGGEWLTAASPYTLPALSDGIHTIKVKAVDRAGWSTEGTVEVYVDTTAPVAFVPVADPGDWTPDNTPTITFDTTDATSGVDHYEVAVNDGPWTVAASPYTLPEQPDGEHLVKIRAIDKAGNIAEGTVKIYIDTTAPKAPSIVRVVPGKDRISVIWTASDPDVVTYRVQRDAAWADGAREVDGATLEIRDEGLTPGDVYAYSLVAIDHAGNVSDPTEWKSAEVAVGRSEYTPDQGNIAEYENVVVVVPIESMPDTVQKVEIREVEAPEKVDASVFPIISPVYEFSVVNEGSDQPEDGAVFEKPVLAQIKYDPEAIPGNFDERNLDVYYFDETFGMWFRVQEAAVDPENNAILFATNHFTLFSIQPTLIKDPTPQEYKDQGYSPLKSYVEYNGVTVSPQNATAMTSVTELVLPGKNGFNFVLTRMYDSATARSDAFRLDFNVEIALRLGALADAGKIMSIVKTENGSPLSYTGQLVQKLKDYILNSGDYSYSMGQGWRLNLPYIKAGTDAVYLHLPDGSTHSFFEMKMVEGLPVSFGVRRFKFEQHEGNDFTVEMDQVQTPKGWKAIAYRVWLKDGTYYELDPLGRTQKMVDATGKNVISFSYVGFNLDSITDSMGRVVKFEYTDLANWLFLSPQRIKKIYVENDSYQRQISYTQDNTSSLIQARDAGGRISHYTYGDEVLMGTSVGARISIWTFLASFLAGPLAPMAEEIFGPAVTLTGHFQAEWVHPMTEATMPGQGKVTLGYEKPTFVFGTAVIHYMRIFFVRIPTSVSLSLNTEQRLYTGLVKVFDTDSGALVRTSSYDLNVKNDMLHQPYVANSVVKETEYRNGTSIDLKRTVYTYIPFSKMRYRWISKTTSKTGLVTFMVQEGSADILTYNSQIEVWDLRSSQLLEVTSFNNYDKVHMRPLQQEIRRSETAKRVINFTYDDWGNLTRQSDTGGNYVDASDDLVTYSAYDNTNSSNLTVAGAKGNPFTTYNVGEDIHDRVIAKIQVIGTPVGPEGTPATLIMETYYQYDGIGNKVSEERTWDPTYNRWLITRYEYNSYGDLTRQIRPDGGETVNEYDSRGLLTKTTSKNVVDARDNSTDITIEYGYEFISGWKLWEKDGRGYVTSYQYDRLGRVVKTIFPDDDSEPANNPTQINEFNDAVVDTMTTDSRGNKTLYDWDSLGRLVRIVKYTRSGSTFTEYAVTRLQYDGLGNVISIQDPNGHATLYDYDSKGNLLSIIFPDNTSDLSDNPRKIFTRNYAAQQVTVLDELGRRSVQYLDMNDKVIREVKYGDFAGLDQKEITVVTVYDARGNKVRETDPRGFTATYYYDPLNRLTKAQMPQDTFWEKGQSVTAVPEVRFEYDAAGNKTAESKLMSDGTWQRTSYTYDNLKRPIRMSVSYTDRDGTAREAVTETYYDANGNKFKVVDPNNTTKSEAEQKAFLYTYSARGWVLSETDPAGNTISYTYDAAGNKVTVTDPRGNATPVENDYTMWLEYDELNRLVKGILPDETLQDLSDNPVTTLGYDKKGNNTRLVEPQGKVTENQYDERNRVVVVTVSGAGKSHITKQEYDDAGNKVEVTDPRNQTIVYSYDDLNRQKEAILPDGSTQRFGYDQAGNRILAVDGRGNVTRYAYNSQNKLTWVAQEAPQTYGRDVVTTYGYDRWGNMTRQTDALGRTTSFAYDEMGRLLSSTDPLGFAKAYGYDSNGNRVFAQDPNGTVNTYIYSANNLLIQLDLVGKDGQTQQLKYAYDAAGNRIMAADDKVVLATVYDSMGRITSENRRLVAEDVSYTTAYRYDKAGRLTGILYPESTGWLEYQYNEMDELTAIPGYINNAPVYGAGGLLASVTTANGVTTAYTWDPNGRLSTMNATGAQGNVLSLNYTYDAAGNIKTRNNNTYEYDELNRLTKTTVEGLFRDVAPGIPGYADADYYGGKPLSQNLTGQVPFDFASSSIGTDLGKNASEISRVFINKGTPEPDRVQAQNLEVYLAGEDGVYRKVDPSQWTLTRKANGQMMVEFKSPQAGRYVKVHSRFDERGENFSFANMSTVQNTLDGYLAVELALPSETLEWQYDMAGNRTMEKETRVQERVKEYKYYENSDRLQTDGTYIFTYDPNGNMISKRTNETAAEQLEWGYKYDLLNRLAKVTKNGTLVAEYLYDPAGFRVEAKHYTTQEKTHYIPNLAAEALYEKELTKGKVRAYVWWNGQHLARAEGDPAIIATTRYFYSFDHEGSLLAATNNDGDVVWQNDYLPYGKTIEQRGNSELAEAHGFTGKVYEEEIGLYYNNARWYDPQLGRFITEDSVNDPNNPNLYAYGANNPLRFMDPTGHWNEESVWYKPSTWFYDSSVSVNQATSGVQGDPNVVKAQGYLSILGFPIGSSGPNKNGVDGKAGGMTKAAIKAFQKMQGLEPTGEIDEATLAALSVAANLGKTERDLAIEANKNGVNFEITPQSSKADFVNAVYYYAILDEAKTGVPAAITTAQAILETGYGQFVPTDLSTGQYSYNLFGIKGKGSAGSVTCGTEEEDKATGIRYSIVDQFAAYNNFGGSIAGHSALLQTDHYKSLFKSKDPVKWAKGLQQKTYATDSQYANLLINVMNSWGLK